MESLITSILAVHVECDCLIIVYLNVWSITIFHHLFLLINHNQGYTCCVQFVMCRSISQVFSATVLLAVHTYFPDMLLLRLFSFRVPVFSSITAVYMEKTVKHTCDDLTNLLFKQNRSECFILKSKDAIGELQQSDASL